MNRTGLRLAFLLPGGFALLAGLDAALLLLGLPAPITTQRLPNVHGILMVYGFIGTVVALERAVAMRQWFGFFSPAFLGLGSILLLTGLPLAVGQWMLVAGMVMLVVIYLQIWRRQAALAVAIQALGAFLGLGGTLLWVGGVPLAALVPSMAVYLVLTIVGERVELARIVVLSDRAQRWALAASVGFAVGAVAALLWPSVGYPLLGVTLLGMVLWLLTFDVATRLVHARGLPRYIAVCLLAGYFWLAVAGGIWLLVGTPTTGPAYDAVLHAVFLGFTMTMIMAHAPVILPAVLRKPLPYRPVLYLPVILLHASLLVRLVLGDGRDDPVLVQWGGAFNVIALLLFVVLAVASVLIGVPKRAKTGRAVRV